jgi:DNA-binding PadR family transcriptional regulator
MINLYREIDIISAIKKLRLRFLEHVEVMSEEGTVKKVFENTLKGKRSVERPRKRWLDDAEGVLEA